MSHQKLTMFSGLGCPPWRACGHFAGTRQPCQLSWRLQRCPLIMHRIVGLNGKIYPNTTTHAYANVFTAPHLGIRACRKKHLICLEIPDVEYTSRNGASPPREAQQNHTSSRSDTDAFPPLSSPTSHVRCGAAGNPKN